MALEPDAGRVATRTGGTGAASTLEQFQRLSHTVVLTFHSDRLDGLAATLEALGLPGTAAAVAARLAQAGGELTLRTAGRAYSLRRAGA
jgi:hypothetical protein